jgi:hypothetical protein
MAEAKQYGQRVNIVKYVRVEKKWRFAAVVEKRAGLFATKSGLPAVRSSIAPKAGTEWHQDRKRRRHSVWRA